MSATPLSLDKTAHLQAMKDREIALNFKREKTRHVNVEEEISDHEDDKSGILTPERPKKGKEKVSMLETLRALQPRRR